MLRFTRVALALIALVPCVRAQRSAETLLGEAEQKIRAEDFLAAEGLLSEALKLDSANTSVLYRLGYVHFRQRKLPSAVKYFSEVVRSAPPAYYSRYFLGRIALLNNQPRQAIEWLEPIVAARQPIFDSASQLAAAYTAAKQPVKAISALQGAIAQTPWDPALYYRLGRLYADTGQKELSVEALGNSSRLRSASSEDVQALMRVSQLLNEGKNAEAVAEGTRVRDRQDPDPNALVALGVLYGGRNMQTEALDLFERAAARDGSFFQAQYNRGLALLKLSRPREALPVLAAATGLLPQSPDANRAYGLAAVMNQQYGEAIEPLKRAWSANQDDERIGALLATAYIRTNMPGDAVAVLRNPVFRTASDAAPRLLLVEALNASGDGDGALAAAEEARRQFPRVPQSHLAAAQQLARLGRYSDALPAFAEALRLAPGHPEAALGLADTLARSGRHEEADPNFRVAMADQRTSAAARAGLARSLIALRKFEDARAILEEGVRLHPTEAALRVELSRVYARLGKPELAAEQTRILEKLRGADR